jgi:3-hydroxyacyl-[acyl-carrier-protein] dehydratase
LPAKRKDKQIVAATENLSRADIYDRITAIMRKDLKIGEDIVISESTPFIGGEADIDSLDILLVLASVERDFGIKISSQDVGRRIFQNVGTLVDYLVGYLAQNSELKPLAATSSDKAADLLQKLPHGPPFRFVSRLIDVRPGESAQGVWAVRGDEDFLKGHFPGRPIVPGVLIAEALAQLSGLSAASAITEGRLAQVDVRFDAAVVPPAEIQLRSSVARTIPGLVQYEVQARCGDLIVAHGTVTLSLAASANSPGAS